jgi:uncharacterized protein YbjT (DUF2867 family)
MNEITLGLWLLRAIGNGLAQPLHSPETGGLSVTHERFSLRTIFVTSLEESCMRLAVLGAAGRTGRAVVSLARAHGHEVVAFAHKPWGAPDDVDVRLGDALDVKALTDAVRGCDAVICAIGPTRGAARDQDSRLGEALLRAMRATGVKRLALVTGAMQGEPRFLGVFYRWLSRLKSVRGLLSDRRLLEQRLLDSGLEVTLLRPPRLGDGPPSVGGAELASDCVITLMDACSRYDLAAALVMVVVQPAARGAVFIRSRPRAGRFWRAWLLRCGLAEVAGIGLAAVTAIGLNRLLPEPQTVPMKLLNYGSFLFIGALEGAFIGLAQGTLLKRLVPTLGLGPFALSTMVPAILGWAIGMAPSTFLISTTPGAVQWSPPSTGVMLLIGVAGGCVGGLLIGGAQWLVLRRHASSAHRWVVASMVGWAAALPLDLLGASLPDVATPAPLIVLSAGGFGLLAGLTFAVPTGWVALGLRALTGSSKTPTLASRTAHFGPRVET